MKSPFPDQTVTFTERELSVLSDVLRRVTDLHDKTDWFTKVPGWYEYFAKKAEFSSALKKIHAAEDRSHGYG